LPYKGSRTRSKIILFLFLYIFGSVPVSASGLLLGASWIQIRISSFICTDPDPDPSIHQQAKKNEKKNLDFFFYSFCDFVMTFYL